MIRFGSWGFRAVAGIVISTTALLISAWLLAAAEADRGWCQSFFGYRIASLDHLPAWFAGVLALFLVNGFVLFEEAMARGVFSTPPRGPWGRWGFEIPVPQLRLVAANLVAIPGILATFLWIRFCGW